MHTNMAGTMIGDGGRHNAAESNPHTDTTRQPTMQQPYTQQQQHQQQHLPHPSYGYGTIGVGQAYGGVVGAVDHVPPPLLPSSLPMHPPPSYLPAHAPSTANVGVPGPSGVGAGMIPPWHGSSTPLSLPLPLLPPQPNHPQQLPHQPRYTPMHHTNGMPQTDPSQPPQPHSTTMHTYPTPFMTPNQLPSLASPPPPLLPPPPHGVPAPLPPSSSSALVSSSSSSTPSSTSPLPPPFSSDVLQTSLDSDLWLLMLHQLYHSRTSWGLKLASEMFQNIQREAEEKSKDIRRSSSAAASSSSNPDLFLAQSWLGVPRSLSLQELMSKHSNAPENYTQQLLRHMLTTTTTTAASTSSSSSSAINNTRANPSALTSSSNRLIAAGAASSGSTLWSTGSTALLPSMRVRLTDSARSLNLVHSLRHLRLGTDRTRLTTSRPPSTGSSNSAQRSELFIRHLRKVKVVTGHKDAIYCVTMDRTSQRVFTGSDDTTVKVWSSKSGQLLQTCRGHSAVITEINVAPDNTMLASASNDSRIRMWDLNGLPLGVLVGHTSDVMRVIFNPDFGPGNRWLVSASLDGTARVWDCSNLSSSQSSPITCKPSPWPSGIEYVPYDLEGLSWEGFEGDSKPQVIPNPEFMCLAFHPSGKEFVAGHNDHRVRVYDMKRRTLLAVLSGHQGEVESVSYSHDGTRILSVAGGEVIIWARIEYEQIQLAATKVGYTLPRTPPVLAGSVWSHQPDAPLHQANFYAGLKRAVASASASAAANAANAPAAAAAAASTPAAQSEEKLISPASIGLPTHRYIILARLAATSHGSSSAGGGGSSSAASTGAGAGAVGGTSIGGSSSSSSTNSILTAVWSLNDDYILGCSSSSSHAVLVWKSPSLLHGAFEMVDPYWQRSMEEAAAAAAAAAQSGKKSKVTTGRSKRTHELDDNLTSSKSKPITFLSCFKRSILQPYLSFSIHTSNVNLVQRHPNLSDVFYSAGSDGRVIFYSLEQRKILKIFHESIDSTTKSSFVDGTISENGELLILTNDMGQLYYYGLGPNTGPYLLPPEQQFFVRDYLGVVRDSYDHVLDSDSGELPHRSPGARTLCDFNGVVYTQTLPEVTHLKLEKVKTCVRKVERTRGGVVNNQIETNNPEKLESSRFYVMNKTGLTPEDTNFQARLDKTDEEVDVDTDVWRMGGLARSHDLELVPSSSSTQSDHLASLRAHQLQLDHAYTTFLHQVRVAVQQQHELLRIASFGGSGHSSSDRGRGGMIAIPPTWTPLISLPLPPDTPVIRLTWPGDEDDHASDDEGVQETRMYRSIVFDSHGMVRRGRNMTPAAASTIGGGHRRLTHAGSLRTPEVSPSRPPRAPRVRTTNTGGGNMGGASNIHTLAGSTRHTAIQLLNNDDDNYHDDDYAPVSPVHSESARARAERRALQRFDDLRAGGGGAGSGGRAVGVSSRSRRQPQSEPEDEEEKKGDDDDDEASHEDSAYSDAEEEVDEPPPSRSRNHQNRNRNRNRRFASSGDESEEEEEEEEEDDDDDDDGSSAGSGSASSDGNSDGSYRRRRSSSKKSRSRVRSDSTGGGGNPHQTRPRKPQRRKKGLEDDDWSDGHDEDEDSLVRSAFARDKRARKRARANETPPPSQRSARKRANYAEVDEDSTYDETIETPAAAAASSTNGVACSSNVLFDVSTPLDSRLYQPGNWLQRPLAQQYNSSYVPQLGDRILYVRAGHESQLATWSQRLPGLAGMKLPSTIGSEVRCLVARIEYMWSTDAHHTSWQRSPNRLFALTRTPHGQIDPLMIKGEPPHVFARLTLVPLGDAGQIRNPAHPENKIKAEEQRKLTHDDGGDQQEQPYAYDSYDFSSLPPPDRRFEFVTFDDQRMTIRLRRTNTNMMNDANMFVDDSEHIQAVRSKRSIRTHTPPAAAAAATGDISNSGGDEMNFTQTASQSSAGPNVIHLPVRQSVRAVLKASMNDALPPPAAASSSSTTDALMGAYKRATSVAASESTTARRTKGRIILSDSNSNGVSPSPTGTSDGASSMSFKIAFTSSSGESQRTSQRQRAPPKRDAYTAGLESADTLRKSSSNGVGVVSTGSTSQPWCSSLELPPSSFQVDLFEPQGADFLILLSRLEGSYKLHPSRWKTGEQFRMKYSDEPDWHTGFICENRRGEEMNGNESTLTTAAGSSVDTRISTRKSRSNMSGSSPSPSTSDWESLMVCWKKLEDLERLLEEESLQRSSSLVNDPISLLPYEQQHDARLKHLLKRFIQEGSSSSFQPEVETVSPWEIDPLERGVVEMEDIQMWLAMMESKEQTKGTNQTQTTPAPSSAAAASSSSAAAAAGVPELVKLLDPVAFIDTSESLSTAATRRILSILDTIIDEEEFEPFCTPVSRYDYPEYVHVVPYGMDLSTMRKRVELRFYRTIGAITHDASSIARAAELYNHVDSDIVQSAKRLEQRIYQELWKEFPSSTTMTTQSATIDGTTVVPSSLSAFESEGFSIFAESEQEIEWPKPNQIKREEDTRDRVTNDPNANAADDGAGGSDPLSNPSLDLNVEPASSSSSSAIASVTVPLTADPPSAPSSDSSGAAPMELDDGAPQTIEHDRRAHPTQHNNK